MVSIIQLDKSTETGIMATMHTFLHKQHDDGIDPIDTVIYSPSTLNQVVFEYSKLKTCKVSFLTCLKDVPI